jgi:hypothetical protein
LLLFLLGQLAAEVGVVWERRHGFGILTFTRCSASLLPVYDEALAELRDSRRNGEPHISTFARGMLEHLMELVVCRIDAYLEELRGKMGDAVKPQPQRTRALGPMSLQPATRTACPIAYPLPFDHPLTKSNPSVAAASTAHAARFQSQTRRPL